jgi:GT2 family glycosyltransferase
VTQHPRPAASDDKLASIVISTYNRRDALPATLEALGSQTVAPDSYEVVVVDDGSTDGTSELLSGVETSYALKRLRLESNRGVSAGRNLGIANATGRYLILLSDDLLVPEDFIAVHVETLRDHPSSWVVGGFRQLESLTQTPFGRFLDGLEASFDRGRRVEQIGPHLWRLEWPTARNLSLPRADLDRVGSFDERFVTTCEDQDLAERAKREGIQFLYTDRIDCLHNDQAATLGRYCNFQRRGARDAVRLCRKHPDVHGASPLIRENGPIARSDGLRLAFRKLVKGVLSRPACLRALERSVTAAERLGAPDRLLFPAYRRLIGLNIMRGWREGLGASS